MQKSIPELYKKELFVINKCVSMRMSVLLTDGPKCTLAASHDAPSRVSYGEHADEH